MKKEELFKHFHQSMNDLRRGNIRVLETEATVEQQLEFLRYSENLHKDLKNTSIDDLIELLQNAESSFPDKKYAMTLLSISGELKAFRALENYSRNEVEPDLHNWLSISLAQARIALEAELSDERQIFIASGLGGKGNKLRFCAIFKAEQLRPFSDYQRKLIEQEFPYHIAKYAGEMEELLIESNYFSIVFLIGLQNNLQQMLEETIDVCNEYGNFISPAFIVTNVKRLDKQDIMQSLEP